MSTLEVSALVAEAVIDGDAARSDEAVLADMGAQNWVPLRGQYEITPDGQLVPAPVRVG